MSVQEKLQKARAALVLSQPFFASIALKMPMVESDKTQTMAVDGRSIYFNPAFVEGLSVPEVVGVLALEVMHVACLHHTRRGGRDHGDWNLAGDYAINGILAASGITLPDGALIEPRFADMSAEEVYRVIHQERPDDNGGGGVGPSGPGDDPGGCGEVWDAPGEDGDTASPAEITAAEEEARVAVLQAAQAAKMQGKLPAGLARVIEEAKAPKADWRTVLRSYIEEAAKNDYSWSRPNRRHIANGLYLPSLDGRRMGEIVLGVDTSGSINGEVLAAFQAEIQAIADELEPSLIRAVYCDAAVAGVDEYEPGEPVRLKPKGGGGTAFQPVFDLVEAEGWAPAVCVYLTDLYGPAPKNPPGYPLVWAVYDNPAPKPLGCGDIVVIA